LRCMTSLQKGMALRQNNSKQKQKLQTSTAIAVIERSPIDLAFDQITAEMLESFERIQAETMASLNRLDATLDFATIRESTTAQLDLIEQTIEAEVEATMTRLDSVDNLIVQASVEFAQAQDGLVDALDVLNEEVWRVKLLAANAAQAASLLS
jgi:hypothetical protein